MHEGLILDVTPGDGESFERGLLEGMGHPVLVCHGPEHGALCPILEGECELFVRAHGIVFQLDLERAQHRAILLRYRELAADDMPICAVVRPGQDTRYADLLAGVEVFTGPPTAGELDGFAAEVEAADRFRE